MKDKVIPVRLLSVYLSYCHRLRFCVIGDSQLEVSSQRIFCFENMKS
jgi:hypothetical protein